MSTVRLEQITPPPLAVTLEAAKANADIVDDQKDSLILGFIRAAGKACENYCSRAFGPQTWRYRLDAFPTKHLDLPWGPVASITSISYLDATETPQTLLAAGVWELEALSDPGTVRLLGAWPTTASGSGAVTITYVAGLGWPEEIKQAVLMLVAHWYDSPAAASAGPQHSVPFGVTMLLDSHRRMFA